MVKILIIIIIMSVFLCSAAYSQIDPEEMGWPFEESPVFSGDLKAFVQKNLCYPDSALKDSIEGIVYVEYLVDTLGFTKNHTIIKGVREDLNNEAKRVAKMIKYESPAKLRGKPVLFYFTMPIEFKLPRQQELLKNGCKNN